MDLVTKQGEIISMDQRGSISNRYKRITAVINREFWGIDSDSSHSLYVGSYGRGTAIDTSDIDILVELPKDKYEQYDAYKRNGQSRLLQSIKDAILSTYPKSEVKPDGQVVKVIFYDGIKFEILPAFQHIDYFGNWNGLYDYPDSNMGGRWLSTNPKAEQVAMKLKNTESNGLLFDTCKHMRKIRDTCFSSYHLPGIVIDSFAYHYIGNWHWLYPGEKSSEPSGVYESSLYTKCPFFAFRLTAPGSGMAVDTSKCIDVLIKVLKHMSK